MVLDKDHETKSMRQSKGLEKSTNFITMKKIRVKKDFESDFFKLVNSAFYGKRMDNVRNRKKVDIERKNDNERIIKQQSNLTFSGIRKSFPNYDSYTFKQNKVLKDKPIYLGFAVWELSKLLMYET